MINDPLSIDVYVVSGLVSCGGDQKRRFTPLRSVAPLVSLQVFGTMATS